MMKNRMIGIMMIFAFLLSPQIIQAQKALGYSDIKISWRDYSKKDVAVSANTAATTAIELRLSSSVENNKLLIVIELIQDRDASWVSRQFLRRASDKESFDLLNHEKLHYAINLIGLKALFKEVSEYEFSKDYKSELAGIFNRVNRITTKSNADYDRQTYHGINKDEQERWEQEVFQQLNEVYEKNESILQTYSVLKSIK